MVLEELETKVTMEQYSDLWGLVHKPRVKTVEVPKKLLGDLLQDHADLLSKLEDYGVSIK